MTKQRLTLFDLDHTLLAGDSDVLWCDFLMDKGLLDRAVSSGRNADMDARYRAGTVGVQAIRAIKVGDAKLKSGTGSALQRPRLSPSTEMNSQGRRTGRSRKNRSVAASR